MDTTMAQHNWNGTDTSASHPGLVKFGLPSRVRLLLTGLAEDPFIEKNYPAASNLLMRLGEYLPEWIAEAQAIEAGAKPTSPYWDGLDQALVTDVEHAVRESQELIPDRSERFWPDEEEDGDDEEDFESAA